METNKKNPKAILKIYLTEMNMTFFEYQNVILKEDLLLLKFRYF